ncbi:hypothetical protein SUGI_0673850 [Cryptomeria japonica]|uniref:endonuclease 4 n=1 Tax=Cryptomeria japonica TaxID=3369 RepID=UPI00241468A1|nr:endonuclease 4 [Cryptomeria japonica]GLJ33499.1 hypothetical protein SUGI_0673850 [Cryptomeria japonica]
MGRCSCALLWIVVISLAFFFPPAESWGKEGHSAVCKIAQSRLNKAAADAVQKLLPDYAEGDLASVCSWADEVKYLAKYRWSSPLHFIDTPDLKCNYEYSRDCHNTQGEEGMCLAGAINNYTAQLATYGKSSDATYNLTEALLFLSHFVGDIHQPLHCGFSGDLGGNTIILHWYGQKSNLHHVWDTLLIETALKDFYDSDLALFTQGLQTNITDSWSNDVSTWEKSSTKGLACPNPYGMESVGLACNWAYKDAPADSVLKDDYFLSRLPVIEEQLAKGGVRLAATLNRIF